MEQHVILFSYLLRLESTLVYSLYMTETVPHVSTYKTLFIGQLLDEKSSNNTFNKLTNYNKIKKPNNLFELRGRIGE